ncbi:HU family DNA-binding protein [bacterium]|nr:HU family DNA-binding protein [bacterium]
MPLQLAKTDKSYIISLIVLNGRTREETIMNREELIAEISKSAKVTKKEASEVLSATIDAIQSAVKKGDKVTLVGFGTFESRKRAARIGRNPQTGKELKIAAKTVPAFSAGKKFKEAVSK